MIVMDFYPHNVDLKILGIFVMHNTRFKKIHRENKKLTNIVGLFSRLLPRAEPGYTVFHVLTRASTYSPVK